MGELSTRIQDRVRTAANTRMSNLAPILANLESELAAAAEEKDWKVCLKIELAIRVLKREPKPYVRTYRPRPAPPGIVAEYEAGASTLELAARHKSHPVQITKWIRAAGGTVRPRGGGQKSQFSTKRVQTILALNAAGKLTLEAIGKRFGITRERVRQICLKHGQEPRLGGIINGAVKKAQEKAAKAEAKKFEKQAAMKLASKLWLSGAHISECAEAMGIGGHDLRTRLCQLRRHHPKMFPYRQPNHWRIAK